MSLPKSSKSPSRLPPWLRTGLPSGPGFGATQRLLADLGLKTVCQDAKCPNRWECFSRNTAAFLVLGPACTRNCAFCNIESGPPAAPDPDEPRRLAQAAARLGLRHVVVTSVTRDDLADGGAGHFREVIGRIRNLLPQAAVEVLVPDFQGDQRALEEVLDAGPEVFNHNLETVPRLYPQIRPKADYQRSLELLSRAAGRGPGRALCKSGLMAGLGEDPEELKAAVRDLARAGCDIVTIGQYMRPSRAHAPVSRYLDPAEFEALAEYGRSQGVRHMYCAPLVRSSYNADMFTRT